MALVWVEWILPPNDILKSNPQMVKTDIICICRFDLDILFRFYDENFQYHNIVKYDINDHRILYHNCALFNLKILNLVPLRYLHMLYSYI